jgi:7,8-dihydroneopterin aldolase/epimerase/oxygenase
MIATIEVNGIRLYANHGCMTEEALIGSEYVVNVTVTADLSKAAVTDDLSDTVDYVHLNRIVAEEMTIRSKLLEHVNQRILNRIAAELPQVATAKVAVHKCTPPINGDVEDVAVVMQFVR